MKLAPKRSVRSAIVLSVAMLVGLTGCQTSSASSQSNGTAVVDLAPITEVQPVENPRTWEGPSTALVSTAAAAPIAENPQVELPVTVTSHDRLGDKEVTVTDSSRVLALSLSGTLAEFVYSYGMGDRLVGRDISTSLPGLEDLPVVTKAGHSIDPESVIALQPTLILTDGTIGPTEVVLQLRDAGISVVTVTRAVGEQGTAESAREVAAALGVGPLGDELMAALDVDIAAKKSEIQHLIPTDAEKLPRIAFLYVRGTAGVYYLFGEGSGADTLISSIGAVDVAKEIGWVGEKPMTDEALVAANPDIIVVMTKGLESADGVDGLIAAQPSIGLTNAGAHRRIIDIEDTLVFAGGTRIPDVIEALARAVYAPDSLPAE